MKPINIIAALSYPDHIIGDRNTNTMLWHIPEDLKRFRQLTNNNIVIMGHNTFKSLPNGPLKNRINIVLSNSQPPSHQIIDPDTHLYYTSHKDVDSITDLYPTKSIFIIGGEYIYDLYLAREFEKKTQPITIHATIVHNYVPDYVQHNYAFFPKNLQPHIQTIDPTKPYEFVTISM